MAAYFGLMVAFFSKLALARGCAWRESGEKGLDFFARVRILSGRNSFRAGPLVLVDGRSVR